MSSTLRRLSTSLPFISKTTSSTDSEPSTSSSPPTTSFFRRKSSSAGSSAEDNSDGSYRALGSRDYKIAVDPEEEKRRRRSSVAEIAEMMTSGEGQGDEEGQRKSERKGSKGRIYGARDWRLIGKD